MTLAQAVRPRENLINLVFGSGLLHSSLDIKVEYAGSTDRYQISLAITRKIVGTTINMSTSRTGEASGFIRDLTPETFEKILGIDYQGRQYDFREMALHYLKELKERGM